MVQNSIKVFFRNINRDRFYAALNIAGLSVGLTASLLVGLYVVDELTFDKFHYNYEEIYHVGLHINFGGQEIKTASSCPPLFKVMPEEIAGVSQITRIKPKKSVVIKYGDKAFTEPGVLNVDSNFLSFFSFKLIEGNAKTALKILNSIVITPRAALKYFGSESAVGKIISVGVDNIPCIVTGIAEIPPSNSHIQFDFLHSTDFDQNVNWDGWGDIGLYTYFRKSPAADISTVDERLEAIVEKYVAPQLEDTFGVSFKEFEKQGGIYAFFTYPLSSSHLFRPEIQDGPSPSGDINYVKMIAVVGIFILLIAAFNFMNLSTARSSKRAKEVGLRKALGSSRLKLVNLFLSESIYYTLFSALIALLGVWLLLPYFNLLTGKTINFYSMLSPEMLITTISTLLIIGIFSGSYPAFYLTAFQPIDALRGKIRTDVKSKGVRRSLVVIQYAISIALMIGTILVYEQLNYMLSKDIGMDKNNVLIIRNANQLGTNQLSFVNAAKNTVGVVDISYTSNTFPGVSTANAFRPKNESKDYVLASLYADYSYLNVLKLELSKGRYFDHSFPDSSSCVINEAALHEFGWEDYIGKKLTIYDDPQRDLNVVGVLKDFNFESFKSRVKPLVIIFGEKSNNLMVKYEGDVSNIITKMTASWKKEAGNQPFDYSFMDQNFDEIFRVEQRMGNFFWGMSVITIFIASLGLLGLALYTAEQRTKEVGIRKVVGASVTSLASLLYREIMVLILIAFGVASLAVWYVINLWLTSFVYRVEIDPWAFIGGGFAALFIALLTVSYHFINVVSLNPTKVLRYE